MLTTLRRMFRVGVRHGFKLMAAFLAVGYGLSLLAPVPAMADAKVDKWKAVALSDVALNERLAALDVLRKDGSSGAVDALEAIAKEGETSVAVAACAQLGRMKSTASKGKLKDIVADTKAPTFTRMGAAACIAEHWKDSGDISYLSSKCSDDSDLNAFFSGIKKNVYKTE